MNLEGTLWTASLIWPVSEIILGLATRARRGAAKVRDRGSLAVLWITITAAIFAGSWLRSVRAARISDPAHWLGWAGLLLLIAGLGIRWTAILTLGRFFNSNVTIHSDHRIVRAGLYRHIRHPSYSGHLLAFGGLALSFGNWLSLLALLVPITAALLYRVHVEESALAEAFGQEYAEYRNSTSRLVPGLY
jgi:protein-S-isoprenylcysteine O-methyltransferase Ste14